MRFFIFLLMGLFSVTAQAQPLPAWVHEYHLNNGADDRLYDVFHTMDDGWACGGGTATAQNRADFWLLKVSHGGEEEFSRSYTNNDGAAVSETVYSLIQTDDGGYLLGGEGHSQSSDMMVVLTDADGEQIWLRFYGGERLERCLAVIELKDGNFLLAGYTTSFGAGHYDGWLVKIDNDGEIIWDHTYGSNLREEFYALREVDDGFLIAGRRRTEGDQDFWLVRTNELGEQLWERTYGIEDCAEYLECMTSCRNGGFILSGTSAQLAKPYIVRINNQGNVLWESHFTDIREIICNVNGGSITQLPDNGFAFAGRNNNVTMTLRLDEAGNYQWVHYNDFGASSHAYFISVLCDDEGGIIGTGYYDRRNQNDNDGLLVQLHPDRTPPYFDSYDPDSLQLTVLLNDTIAFNVDARDLQADSILYVWTLDADTVSTDTVWVKIFDEIGEWDVSCAISDRDPGEVITWHVTVSDFFISTASPESLEMTVRRGSVVPFKIELACVEPEAPTIEWSTINRDNDRLYLGEADSIEVTFDLAGDWAVEAEEIWSDERESIHWVVTVRSAVWWWLPREENLEVIENELRDFTVFPFNPESDSLNVAWWFDRDSLDCDDETLTLDFFEINELGEHVLTTIVHDGIEADTISWQINVIEFSSVSQEATYPTELSLSSPFPNPFNSTTTIGYSVPVAGMVSLAVYDLSGREVARLANGVMPAGTHEAVWVAEGMSSGVYVVKLVAGEKTAMSKVVLVR